MNRVKIKRTELLEVLKKNREAHRDVFLKALSGYRVQAIIELERSLSLAKSGNRVCRSIELDEPMDMTREYDRVIRMLEMSVDQEIEVSASEFQCYVMDEWQWKQQVLSMNSKYLSS